MTAALPASALEPTDEVLGVLEDYLLGQEGGAPPDPEGLLARPPHLADPLRACLASLEFLHDAAQGLRGPKTPHPPPDAPADQRGLLGDFRIVREVGRGGMGVVYEAFQLSLARRVALKVLPFASTLDPRQLQRFKNEAQTAAQLHHEHIVPVYAVGLERGIHSSAMQFIEGPSLAGVLRQLRAEAGLSPDPDEPATAPERVRRLAKGALVPAHQPVPAGDTAGAAAGLLSTERSARGASYFRAVGRLGIQA